MRGASAGRPGPAATPAPVSVAGTHTGTKFRNHVVALAFFKSPVNFLIGKCFN